ncbi:tetratricopeptide repeat protein [Amycolatopsis sulphurea]|uniref:Tetratricopeptide repeat protein n=1 Tax=Amycolatopsis sulphurea TaxID=76022 RepID=A0A2A9G1C8_9PSEU|nr:tetratricopeptide repeat protein [Amycolatopsis sulphurea]PFG56545.1 tetratricopeptide repeat protein [Amycolatopsis sulphurea]
MGLFRANSARKQAAELAKVRKALAKRADQESPDAMVLRHRLGLLLVGTGDWPAAEEHYTELAEAQVRVAGEQDPGTLGAWANLAVARAAQGRITAGLDLLESTVERYAAVLGPGDPATLQAQVMLSEMLSLAGNYPGALAVLDRYHDGCREQFGPAAAETVAAGFRKVGVLRTLARFEEARQLHEELSAHASTPEEQDEARTIELLIKAESGKAHGIRLAARLHAERRPTADSVEVLATVLRRAGEPAEAAVLYRSLLAAAPAGSPRTWSLAGELARACLESGDLDQAEHLAGGLVESTALPGAHPLKLGFRATLARTARARGRDEEADRELAAVVAGLTEVFGAEHPDTVEAAEWLREGAGG